MAVKGLLGDYLWGTVFLSRLCGGEVIWIDGSVIRVFLSRLCGGEEISRRDSPP